MPLICQDCFTSKKTQLNFYQISTQLRGEPYKREIMQPTNGLRMAEWVLLTERQLSDGIYCAACDSLVNDLLISKDERELLKDNRMEALSFNDIPLGKIISDIKEVSNREGSKLQQYSVPEKAATFGDLEYPLPHELSMKLKEKGIGQLYSHQAEAVNKVRKGENVVITTGTASGKSLVYSIPVLESFIEDDKATALYLSPLKALTRDQLQSLDMFNHGTSSSETSFGFKTIRLGDKEVGVGILEGGKADSVKELTYQNARYWLTNVHYLHYILQGAVHFKKKGPAIMNFFKNLKYVVVDELHAYNGVLGSKVSMLLRRIRSLCKALGTSVQFITCSASIGNPKELAEDITGLKGINGFSLIEEDGSPAYQREILLMTPGLLGNQTDNRLRRAPISEAIEILKHLAYKYGKLPKSILFHGNRKSTETASFELNKAIRTTLREKWGMEGMPQEYFSPFHAHINAYKKQEIMSRIKKGELSGLVSTSALEMGIDIGDLDICIMVGYAGSKASFLQQAGRVGRKGPGLVIQIFQEDPLEQYYASNPVEFMERQAEHVAIDVSNPNIVAEHLQYAAHELNGKISGVHQYFKVSAARKSAGFLDNMAEIKKGTWELTTKELLYNPLVSGGKVYSILTQKGNTKDVILEGVDERTVLRDYHYGAVFLYNQHTYRVLRISQRTSEIVVVPIKAEYTTRSQVKDSIYIEKELERSRITESLEFGKGTLEVTRRLWGYKKVPLYGGSISDLITEINMYPVKYTTEGLWLQFADNQVTDAALHVVEHALTSAIPSVVKCSNSDFALLSSSNLNEFGNVPTIVLYETGGGGAGIMDTVSERLHHILNKALSILKSCECDEGCPNCTHLSRCERNNESLDKQGGVELIAGVMHEEMAVIK
ncbi:DEAD/DEAH box helicase [Rossellomorea vietnamensis]|uniref:DEAD/DEAH box helicase n=1 Tax=Rossellomorea vietnamensis TaxID=218284 RepID=A0A5D4K778_9BACI|nr:DEAD/DEAH box helicase [Rossellomorea vietnamensis]TYR73138.1 DEAD/DEAH box helicase [Rossellomorea vietnamensis]